MNGAPTRGSVLITPTLSHGLALALSLDPAMAQRRAAPLCPGSNRHGYRYHGRRW